MSPSLDSPTVVSAPVISADALHEVLLQAHVLGNQARRKFLEGLLAMQRSRLYLALGFPSVVAVLYHVCPDCRSSRMATAEGLVEVPVEVVERVEGEAECVEIRPEEELREEGRGEDRDRPNTPQLVKKVRLRDGRVCSNPLCRRRTGLHAHHIEFRSHGGRTELANEKLVCSVCHSLLHQGLLEIEGDPLRGVTFHPKSRNRDSDLRNRVAVSGKLSE